MLNFLKKIVSPPSPTTEPVAAPPTPAPVAPYMRGLRAAVLSGGFNQETDELFSGFPISAEDTVLDVGCGDGGNVHFCAMRGARIIIADIDAEKIARTRERLADTPARELECLVSDCDPLPLADATATRVVSTEVIEHVDDPRQFLAELVRVGQPGALYLLSVPHPTSEDLQKDFAADEYFRKPNHIRVLGEEQFAALVREAGLEILSHSRYGFYWSLWMLLFWEAKVDFGNPDHPLLEHWARTWQALLDSPRGPAIKQALDAVVAKSQVIIARKPAQA
ncbi:class I SAM-dependent methyltransferase [Pseudomonas aeruginosa]|nr:class I SAM-dependent methyltransferase [Pseudomonas aeruginosa]